MSNEEPPPVSRLRLWTGRPEGARRSRGPAPAYTRERIADAAISIADEHGLAAVTMRRVARQLGTGAMSLYRYVPNKEALLELVGDRMFFRHDWPAPTGRWREDLCGLAHSYRRTLLRRPWLLRVWWRGSMVGPEALAHLDRALSIVDGLGLDVDAMFETVTLVTTWVSGHVHTELEGAVSVWCEDERAVSALREYLVSVAEHGRYPYCVRLIAGACAPGWDADAGFARALDRVLDGIEATLPRAAERAPGY